MGIQPASGSRHAAVGLRIAFHCSILSNPTPCPCGGKITGEIPKGEKMDFEVVRDNAAKAMLEHAEWIARTAKAINGAQNTEQLIECLTDMQYRCCDTIMRCGGKIGHVLLAETKQKEKTR
jgi:hypothetical protein